MYVQIVLYMISLAFFSSFVDAITIAQTICTGELFMGPSYTKGNRVEVSKSAALKAEFSYTFTDDKVTATIKFVTEHGASQALIKASASHGNAILAYYEPNSRQNRDLTPPIWNFIAAGEETCVKVPTRYITDPSGWFTLQSHYGTK